jgi:hypothetical protein
MENKGREYGLNSMAFVFAILRSTLIDFFIDLKTFS